MPKRIDVSKIGSLALAPIMIGQSAELDNSGTHDSHYLFKDFVKMEEWKG